MLFNSYCLQTVVGNQANIYDLSDAKEKDYCLDLHHLMDPDHFIETGFFCNSNQVNLITNEQKNLLFVKDKSISCLLYRTYSEVDLFQL